MQTAYIQVLDNSGNPVTELFYAEDIDISDRNQRSSYLSFKVLEPDDALILALYPREEIIDQRPFPIRKLVVKDRPDSISYTILKHAVLTAIDLSNMDMTTPEGTEELNCRWVFCERSIVLENEEIRVEPAPPYADRMHEWHDEYMPWREEERRPREAIRRAAPSRPGREDKVIWLTDGF